MKFVNRVYLPSDQLIYVSDDDAGDKRLLEIYRAHGDLKVDMCKRVLGSSLDSLEPYMVTTVKKILTGECWEWMTLNLPANLSNEK